MIQLKTEKAEQKPRDGYVVYQFNVETLRLEEEMWCSTEEEAHQETQRCCVEYLTGPVCTYGWTDAKTFDALK